ncbi:hypothetical protein [Sphingobacterium bambusae]|uniref:FecR protein domain-containing protein n=1 Tax=Sphingobacterium bambusae TaxID=662858 RepID=A0ABW6BMG7_9SPHI|nr:hypothetical protein [Sphingobacterium bambusae]WPL46668.1 hypothetical protein SCB77_11880 [Sphingobacterium bambusae]
MEISKALLEKYELGQCTDQERDAVQKWLDNDRWEDEEDMPEEDQAVKADIWANLTAHIANEAPSATPLVTKKRVLWPIYAAAACLLLVVAVSAVRLQFDASEKSLFYADNKQHDVAWQHEQNFDLLLSKNSSAQIDLHAGSIALSGNIMFKPKRDFTLHDTRNNRVFHFKRNQVYVLSEHPSENKFLVFQKDEMAFLPPPIQRKLKKQFQIT